MGGDALARMPLSRNFVAEPAWGVDEPVAEVSEPVAEVSEPVAVIGLAGCEANGGASCACGGGRGAGGDGRGRTCASGGGGNVSLLMLLLWFAGLVADAGPLEVGSMERREHAKHLSIARVSCSVFW